MTVPPARLTPRAITLLAVAALIVPIVALICVPIAIATAGPNGELTAFGPYFCRRGNCIGEAGSTIPSSVAAVVSVMPYVAAIAVVGFVIAVLTRRRGWITIPAILGFLLFVMIVSVNAVAYSLSGGAQVPGTIIIGVVLVAVPAAVIATGRAAMRGLDAPATAAAAPAA